MRNLLILALLFISFLSLQGQNWQPLKVADSYNYKLGDTSLITHVIKTDSVEVVDGDSVFYLNRIMTNCDTCSDNQNNMYALRNQPQFLMRSMIKKSDSIFVFEDTGKFLLKPLAKPGHSWVFDTLNNIDASVVSSGTEEIFGEIDSIKQITLSNDRTILLSKSYGILQFPSVSDEIYQLVGVEGSHQKGEKLPGYTEFYDFTVGDIFQRKYRSVGGGDGDTYEYLSKYTITSKQINGDTLTYGIHVYKCSWGFQNGHYVDTSGTEYNSTLNYVNSPGIFVNRYPNQIYDFSHIIGWTPVEMYNRTIYTERNGRTIKYAGDLELWDFYPHYRVCDTLPDLLIRNNDDMTFQFGYVKFKEGFGKEYVFNGFEYFHQFYFTGKVHAGDTIGGVKPDSFYKHYLGIDEHFIKEINVYPNPAADELKIDFGTIQPDRVAVFDTRGRKVLEKELSLSVSKKVLRVGTLPQGIYVFVVYKNQQALARQTFMKQ